MYSVMAYGKMVADRFRTDAYKRALKLAIIPGVTVLDIGTGATGLFAMLACCHGARRVYAIEPDDSIELAREIARANGFDDRIVFIQGLSTRVTLPERADVAISDLRGVLPLFQHHIASVKDARARLLSSGGTLIPREDRVWVAVAEAPKLYEPYQQPWYGGASGLDLKAGLKLVTNTWGKGRLTPDQLLTEPGCWATLDYTKIEDPHVQGEVDLPVTRQGTAHGLGLWFDSTLLEGVELSNAPGAPELLYGQAFFPLSRPVEVLPGDVVSAVISANLVGEDYVWRWDTRVASGGNASTVKVAFSQSSFFGAPLSLARLRKRVAGHVPLLNADGEVQHSLLSLFAGQQSLQQIAEELVRRFPDRFKDRQEALATVANEAEKYSR